MEYSYKAFTNLDLNESHYGDRVYDIIREDLIYSYDYHQQIIEEIAMINKMAAYWQIQELLPILKPQPLIGWRDIKLDVLNQDQKELTGTTTTIDINVTNKLPLWSDVLSGNGHIPESIMFPSDLNQDLKPPIITTFYSLKGGVGRSTALAYTAKILASKGLTVLCVDMDLEAPSLAALFNQEKELKDGLGLLSVLLAMEQGRDPHIQEHIIRISDTDELYCLPAGLLNANYVQQLNLMDASAWYNQNKKTLRSLIDSLTNDLSFEPDVILLDAPTGINPINGPLLFDLADLAIIVFFPHPQIQSGIKSLLQGLLSSHTYRKGLELTTEPRFLVSPIPGSKAAEIVQRYQHRALEWVNDWLSPINDQRTEIDKLNESVITHFIPYREVIATSDEISSETQVWQDFQRVAQWIEIFFATKSEQQLQAIGLHDIKPQILSQLHFSSKVSEYQPNFLQTFVESDSVTKALQNKISLILGHHGAGKTAIFRYILEKHEKPAIISMSPDPLKGKNFWVISPYGFERIEETLNLTKTTWSDFWLLQICLSCYLSSHHKLPIPDVFSNIVVKEKPVTELQVVYSIKKMLAIANISTLAKDWLMKIDQASQPDTMILFDGLNKCFGSKIEDKIRRNKSLEGLLSLITSISDVVRQVKFKVFLREDLWTKLNFPSKNYYYGRSVNLNWNQKDDFCKVAIKHALLSPSFQRLIKTKLQIDNYEHWLEYKVWDIWTILVGERMKGGAFGNTIDWIWYYLSDVCDQRSPRDLLQLLETAIELEKSKQPSDMYWKTILRSRSLTQALQKVSEQAINSLLVEFPELSSLVEQLRYVGKTPVKSNKLSGLGLESALELGREVGLLGIYSGSESEIESYKVPEIYRLGLGMSRKV